MGIVVASFKTSQDKEEGIHGRRGFILWGKQWGQQWRGEFRKRNCGHIKEGMMYFMEKHLQLLGICYHQFLFNVHVDTFSFRWRQNPRRKKRRKEKNLLLRGPQKCYLILTVSTGYIYVCWSFYSTSVLRPVICTVTGGQPLKLAHSLLGYAVGMTDINRPGWPITTKQTHRNKF